jgi:hypothetical protein
MRPSFRTLRIVRSNDSPSSLSQRIGRQQRSWLSTTQWGRVYAWMRARREGRHCTERIPCDVVVGKVVVRESEVGGSGDQSARCYMVLRDGHFNGQPGASHSWIPGEGGLVVVFCHVMVGRGSCGSTVLLLPLVVDLVIVLLR